MKKTSSIRRIDKYLGLFIACFTLTFFFGTDLILSFFIDVLNQKGIKTHYETITGNFMVKLYITFWLSIIPVAMLLTKNIYKLKDIKEKLGSSLIILFSITIISYYFYVSLLNNASHFPGDLEIIFSVKDIVRTVKFSVISGLVLSSIINFLIFKKNSKKSSKKDNHSVLNSDFSNQETPLDFDNE